MAHIVLIDDAPDLRLLMRMALQSDGHTITDADGGVRGLQILENRSDVDLVLLDVQMPVVDGWDVLEHLRELPEHGDTPVVMCTVKFSHQDLIHAWELGCDGYLNKPFDLSDLTTMASAIIETDADVRRRRRADMLTALHATDSKSTTDISKHLTNGLPSSAMP